MNKIQEIWERTIGIEGVDTGYPKFEKELLPFLVKGGYKLYPPFVQITGETSDGFHTFNELYEFRKLYNAGLFNEWAKQGLFNVHKSKKHSDGEECFGGGWFIVTATLPTGQISNHYELKDWDLFQVEERELADVWDGHTAQDVAHRLNKYITNPKGDTE